MDRFCVVCQKDVPVISWLRDDPVLECGHVKTLRDQCRADVEQALLDESRRLGLTIEEVRSMLIDQLLTNS